MQDKSGQGQAKVSRHLQRYGADMSSKAAVVESSMIARSRYNNKTTQHHFVARLKARSKAMAQNADILLIHIALTYKLQRHSVPGTAMAVVQTWLR